MFLPTVTQVSWRMMLLFIVFACFVQACWGQAQMPVASERRDGQTQAGHLPGVHVRLVDNRRNALSSLEIGSNAQLHLTGLRPSTMYSIVLRGGDGQLISWARLTSERDGSIPPFVLWYQTGVVGCTPGLEKLKTRFSFRSHMEAEQALAGRELHVEVLDSDAKLVSSAPLRVASQPARPVVYAGNADGCLLNSFSAGHEDVYVIGRNFPPGSTVEVYLSKAQPRWDSGEALQSLRRGEAGDAPLKVRLAANQRDFAVLLWKARDTHIGSYDLIARHCLEGENHAEWKFIGSGDVVKRDSASTFVVQEVLEVDPHLSEDIAGRIIYHTPWFQHVNAFAKGEDIWGALDPKKKPASNPYAYAAWYVVDHKDVWADGDSLNDVTGGAEITPVQPGCINSTWTKLWATASPPGLGPNQPTKAYDVVIHFGNFTPGPPVTAPGTYVMNVDFIDRAEMAGFYVMDDPTAPGGLEVGSVDLNQGCDYSLDKTVQWTDDFVTTPVTINLLDPKSAWEPCNNPADPMYDPNHKARILARIKYPKAPGPSGAVASGGPFPLVLFLHGQQGFGVEGWKGYDYLLDLLASHGFIAMSVDSNDFLDANHISRGELVREYLRRMRDRNAPGGASINGVSFVGAIDMNKVAIAGHSKGGEAVVAAYELQRVNPDPGYTIRGIISIAPVQAIGEWGWTDPSISLRLKNVPYLIIHGAKDGDVSDFQGMRIYDRAAPFQSPGNTPRQMVFIKDANHDFFNSSWILPGPPPISLCTCDRVANPLPPDVQQSAAKLYIHAFVEAYIHNNQQYLSYFTGVLSPPVALPIEVITSYHPASTNRFILDHMEDTNPRSATLNTLGGPVTAGSLDLPATGTYPGIIFNEYQLRTQAYATARIPTDPGYAGDSTVRINDSFPHFTHGAVFGWNNGGDTYSVEVPATCVVDGVSYSDCRAQAANFTHFSFRVAQVFRDTGNQNPQNQPQDFSVVAVDSTGSTSTEIWVSSYASIPFPYTAATTSGADGPKSVLRTVRIPLAAFTVSSSVDISKLKIIQFRFNRTAIGEIALDDLEFVK